MSDLNKVIANILTELDEEQANYQLAYKKIYGKADEQARHTYALLTKLCERIRKEAQERK